MQLKRIDWEPDAVGPTDRFRDSDGVKILNKCSVCREVDVLDCNDKACPHKFPAENKANTADLIAAVNTALTRSKA